jgi:hypothetical protein
MSAGSLNSKAVRDAGQNNIFVFHRYCIWLEEVDSRNIGFQICMYVWMQQLGPLWVWQEQEAFFRVEVRGPSCQGPSSSVLLYSAGATATAIPNPSWARGAKPTPSKYCKSGILETAAVTQSIWQAWRSILLGLEFDWFLPLYLAI